MLVALRDFLATLQFLIVPIVHAEGLADFLDILLIGRRVIAAWGFVAAGVRAFGVGIDVAGSECRKLRLTALGVFEGLGSAARR